MRLPLATFVLFTSLAAQSCQKEAAPPGDTYEIKPLFRPGQTLYVEFKQDVSTVISEIGAPDVPSGLIRHYGMLMTTLASSPERTEVRFKLDRAAHTKRSMYLQKPFDSDLPGILDDIGMTQTYTPLLGLDVTFTLDDRLKVTDLKNVELFEAKILESKAGPIASDAARDFSAERLKMVWIEYPLALFPDRPVKVGDTWTNSIIENFPIGKVELPHECRLEKISDEGGRKTAVVTFRGTMKRLEKGFAEVNQINITSYHFTFEGQAVYDFEVGQFVNRMQTNRTVYKYPGRSPKPDMPPPEQTVTVVALQSYRIMSESQRRAEKEKNYASAPPTSQPTTKPD